MKNMFLAIIIAMVVTLFFSFTNNRPVLANEDEYTEDEPALLLDTVPKKRDTTKKKSGTTPYDSFGKPKKMDTTHSK